MRPRQIHASDVIGATLIVVGRVGYEIGYRISLRREKRGRASFGVFGVIDNDRKGGKV
jgi:hypothetical protein